VRRSAEVHVVEQDLIPVLAHLTGFPNRAVGHLGHQPRLQVLPGLRFAVLRRADTVVPAERQEGARHGQHQDRLEEAAAETELPAVFITLHRVPPFRDVVPSAMPVEASPPEGSAGLSMSIDDGRGHHRFSSFRAGGDSSKRTTFKLALMRIGYMLC